MQDTGILLESGTNEFEVLIFDVGHQSFGVNVAKVREIITPSKIIPYPGQPDSMLGMISLRGNTVPLICLHTFFGLKDDVCKDVSRRCIIVMEFSSARCAFQMDGVEQIVRASWNQIRPLPDIGFLRAAKATGVFMFDERMVPMVDFEWIYSELFPRKTEAASKEAMDANVDRGAQSVYIADDSPAIRSSIEQTLIEAGYVNVRAFNNGEACWDQLRHDRDADELPNVVITDIEMPLMDGLALTRSIKEDSILEQIPVILFSSLISEDNKNKGERVGADAQLSKPMIADVVRYADQLISRSASKGADSQLAG